VANVTLRIGIQQQNSAAARRQAGSDVNGGCRLSDAALHVDHG
jgi:hypothetical protein